MKNKFDPSPFINNSKEKIRTLSNNVKIPGLKGLTVYDIANFIYHLIKKGNLSISISILQIQLTL